MDPQLIEILKPLIPALAIASATLAGVWVGQRMARNTAERSADKAIRGQLAVERFKARRERRSKQLETFMRHANGRWGLYLELVRASGFAPPLRREAALMEILVRFGQEHPGAYDQTYLGVSSSEFMDVAERFRETDMECEVMLVRPLMNTTKGSVDASIWRDVEVRIKNASTELNQAAESYINEPMDLDTDPARL